ncbi:hypothetical protein AGMMS49936_11410 [Endomicrobiia bacterium]|nr:hypothetical protein AGMMS49936_11410 [Endomicrobiia bacterium]
MAKQEEKRHTIKTLVIVEIKGEQIIRTAIDRARITIIVYLKRHVFMQRKTIRYMAGTIYEALAECIQTH